MKNRHLRIGRVVRACACIALALSLCACNLSQIISEESAPRPTQAAADEAGRNTPAPAPNDISGVNFRPQFDAVGMPYVPLSVTPAVKDYKVAADLSNIANLKQFTNLTPGQRALLAQNGFVVSPTQEEQLYYVYEDNAYKLVPSFITTDSVLQAYHVFYGYTLRNAEAQTFFPEASQLAVNMLQQLIADYGAVQDPAVKALMLKAIGYCGAAQLAFGDPLPQNFPREMVDTVMAEMALFDAAESFTESPLLGVNIDYSLFKPRGHYTRSEALSNYFRGMTWLGNVPLAFYDNNGARSTDTAMQAMLLSYALCRLPNKDGGKLWENIYSATSFFVGSADDLTPYQIAEILVKVYGENPDINMLADPSKMDAFYAELDKLPPPRIVSKADKDAKGLQMRFMGQRYIPDSEILQTLSDDLRAYPAGLDIFAVLGSERAKALIDTYERPQQSWPDYPKAFAALERQFAGVSDSVWQSNMYYAWIYTLRSLTGSYGAGYPMFMRNEAWQDKSLATALGSWAELRHDTILYAKGTAAEGGDEDEQGADYVRSYVEPNVEVYGKLLWMTSFARQNLGARNLLPEAVDDKMQDFEAMLSFLLDCSVKELEGKDLARDEHKKLLEFGGWLELLTMSLSELDPDSDEDANSFYSESDADRRMAIIADIHTGPSGYLEEAVGNANEIYVVFPAGGKLYIGRGAVFDYYEFISDERLTDEQWQAMLPSAPQRPQWTRSFITQGGSNVPSPYDSY